MNKDDFWARLSERRLTRRRLLASGALTGAGLAAAAVMGCGGDEEEGASAQPSAGEAPTLKHGALTYAVNSQGASATLSPNTSISSFATIYDSLTRIPDEGLEKLEPGLATSWQLDKPTRWVFTLREASWSDGKPFTAEDVKYTFDYIADANNKSVMIGRVATVDSVEIIDKKTVAFNTKGPDPLLHGRNSEIPILPKHILGDPSLGDQSLATKPIGTASYVVVDYSRGASLKLKASPSSWRGTRGVDEANQLVIEDGQTRVAAFEAGDVAYINFVPLPDIERLRGLKNSIVRKPESNLNDGYAMALFDPPFKDVRVRMAVNQAVNLELTAKTVFFDLPKVLQGQVLTESTFGFNPNLKAYKFDPSESRRLLKEAGFGDGFSTKIQYRAYYLQSKPYVEAIADYLKDVGIKAEIEPMEINIWRDGYYGRTKRAGLFGATFSGGYDASFAFQWHLSDNPGKWYARKDFDDAYNAAVAEFDLEKRKRAWWRCTEIQNTDPPMMFGVEQITAIAYRSDKIKKIGKGLVLDQVELA